MPVGVEADEAFALHEQHARARHAPRRGGVDYLTHADVEALGGSAVNAAFELRAAAIVKPDTDRDTLKRMADLGVRALRFHHMPHGIGFSSLGMQSFEKLAPIMADLGLHAQFMMDANALDSALPFFKHWTLPVVIDHMGNVDGTLGAGQPGVQQMCRLLGEGSIWVKVSGSYRVSTQYPDYPDAKPIHEALVRANPDQIIWGTDWPHPRMEKDMPEDGHLLDLFNAWTPDAGLRKRILVDNPERLYGFS